MKVNFNYIEVKSAELLKENNLFKPNFDIRLLCKRLEITVEDKVLGKDVSGFLISTSSQRSITVNRANHPTRQRFTIAHEIGHYLFHSTAQHLFVDKAPKVMFRDANSTTGEDLREREANAFAAALLMPAALLQENVIKAPDDITKAISYLANKFGVSENAMTFRLSNLGYSI